MGFLKNRRSDQQDVKTVVKAGKDAFAAANARAAELATQYAGEIQAAHSMDLNAQLAIGQRLQRIATTGIDGTATVVSATESGPGASGAGVAMALELMLTAGPGAPRPLTLHQDMMGSASSYPPGTELQVKIDPSNPDDAILWATAPGGSDMRMAKLEQLAAMHEAGAFTDEEFAAKKAAVLAED